MLNFIYFTTHLIISILSLYYIMHLFNIAFKSFYNLIHNNILLILIIYNYKKIFQLIIFSMSECFQNFNRFFKFFNIDFIIFIQFYIINVVVVL